MKTLPELTALELQAQITILSHEIKAARTGGNRELWLAKERERGDIRRELKRREEVEEGEDAPDTRRKASHAPMKHRDQDLEFAHAKRKGSILEFVLAPREKMDGWFGLGRVHLIGGSSGTGKTTLIVKALVRQANGEVVFGHQGMKRRALVLFADRGPLSNRETLLRLRIDEKDIPTDYISADAFGLAAVQEILGFVEKHNLPEVVFVEAADALVEDQSKQQFIVPFMKGLQRVAEHYHLAVILSVGAPKMRNGDKHQAQRDRIIGSEKWGRLAEDVLTLEFVSDGNGTENDRTLTMQHRNAVAEKFKLAYAPDGSELVEKQADAGPPVDQDEREAWIQSAGWFSQTAFAKEFKMSSGRAKDILRGLRGRLETRRGKFRWKGVETSQAA